MPLRFRDTRTIPPVLLWLTPLFTKVVTPSIRVIHPLFHTETESKRQGEAWCQSWTVGRRESSAKLSFIADTQMSLRPYVPTSLVNLIRKSPYVPGQFNQEKSLRPWLIQSGKVPTSLVKFQSHIQCKPSN